MRSYQLKRKNNIIIGVLCAVVLLMAVGYAAFSSILNIKGVGGISSNWDIEITNIRGANPWGGDAYDISEPTYTKDTATFNTGLKTPGDSDRVYEVEISNLGSLKGAVTIANLSCGNNDAIGCWAWHTDNKHMNDDGTLVGNYNKYGQYNFQLDEDASSLSDISFEIKPGEKQYLYVNVWYDDKVTSQPEDLSAGVNLELTYEQEYVNNEGVAVPTNNMMQSWSRNSVTDFHASEYKQSIISATFLDNKEIPSTATESWDVSVDNNGNVMAWVVPSSSDSSKYDLYIGADGGVVANMNSSYLFCYFRELQTINFGNNFDTSNVINMESMFEDCYALTALDLSSFDTSNVTNMSSMFDSCQGLTSLDLSSFDTSRVIDMNDMFCDCTELITLNLSNFDTSNVIYMYCMFQYSYKLTTIIGLNEFDTSNVVEMENMFLECHSLTNLDLSNFNTSKVTDMSAMFWGCETLVTLNISSFDTSNVTDMAYMFEDCYELTTIIGLNAFDTSRVTDMFEMFADCTNLEKLNLCSFDTTSATDARKMFNNTTKLAQIYVSDKWDMNNANVTDMFTGSASSSVIQSNNCMVDAGISETTQQSSNEKLATNSEETATTSAETVANEAMYSLRKIFA